MPENRGYISAMDTRMRDYLPSEVRIVLDMFQQEGKLFRDYRIAGNTFNSTIVLRFTTIGHMHDTTPRYFSPKSSSTMKHDSERQQQQQVTHHWSPVNMTKQQSSIQPLCGLSDVGQGDISTTNIDTNINNEQCGGFAGEDNQGDETVNHTDIGATNVVTEDMLKESTCVKGELVHDKIGSTHCDTYDCSDEDKRGDHMSNDSVSVTDSSGNPDHNDTTSCNSITDNPEYQAFVLNIMEKRRNTIIRNIYHDRRHGENWLLGFTDDLIIRQSLDIDVCEVYNPLTPGYQDFEKMTKRWKSIRPGYCSKERRCMQQALPAILDDQKKDIENFEKLCMQSTML